VVVLTSWDRGLSECGRKPAGKVAVCSDLRY
jgi:hypothetical protein